MGALLNFYRKIKTDWKALLLRIRGPPKEPSSSEASTGLLSDLKEISKDFTPSLKTGAGGAKNIASRSFNGWKKIINGVQKAQKTASDVLPPGLLEPREDLADPGTMYPGNSNCPEGGRHEIITDIEDAEDFIYVPVIPVRKKRRRSRR